MNIDQLMKRAQKVIAAHEARMNVSKVHVIDAQNAQEITNLNGLVLAIDYDSMNKAIKEAENRPKQ